MIKLMLVDNHSLFREGIAARLRMQDNITIISEVDNRKQLLEQLTTLIPDIVLMDISMPEINGMDALEIIKEKYPDLRVIVLSMSDDKEYILSVIRFGACGYMLKDIAGEEMIKALQKVHGGGKYFSAEIAEILAQEKYNKSNDILTTREQLILRLISHGYNNKNIATDLDIIVRIVKTHNRNIKQKLNIYTTSGLVWYAIEYQLNQ